MTGRVRHLKKDDLVVLWRSDSKKRQTGKILEVDHTNSLVKVEGVGITKRHSKPTQTNPKGGVQEGLRWWPAAKFRVCDNSAKPLGRAGYVIKDGKKERVFSKTR